MKTTALFAPALDRVELIEATVPDPGPGQVLVETLFSSVSPGTELRCMRGGQPGAGFPFIPGYSLVGRIAARGAGVKLAEGTLVFCQGSEAADRPLLWGGHLGHAVCGEDNVIPLPAGVDPLEASMIKLAAIAYRGVRAAGTMPHHQVAVIGLGVIGQLAARLHRLSGARVVAADLSAERVALARAAGIEAVVPSAGLVAAFQAVQPGGADIVVDSTGAPAVLEQSVLLAKPKPWDDTLTEPTRLVIQGSYAANVSFDYHHAFARELTVHLPRDCQPRDRRLMLQFLAGGVLKVRDLITEVHAPAEAPEVYAALRAARPGLLTAAFRWR